MGTEDSTFHEVTSQQRGGIPPPQQEIAMDNVDLLASLVKMRKNVQARTQSMMEPIKQMMIARGQDPTILDKLHEAAMHFTTEAEWQAWSKELDAVVKAARGQ